MRSYVESSLEQFAGVYEKQAVAERFQELFQTFGLSDTASYFFDINNYEYVEPTNGVVDANAASGKIAITAVDSGQELRAFPSQRSLETHSDIAATVASLAFIDERRGSGTCVRTRQSVVVLYRHEIDGNRPMSPGVIAHELTHVAQNQLRPNVTSSVASLERQMAYDVLTRELQAYASKTKFGLIAWS